MVMRFSPSGHLDVASDASDLPSEINGKIESSGAMTRCTNMHLDRLGIAETRFGSSKLNTDAIWREAGTIEYGTNLFDDPLFATQAKWLVTTGWTFSAGVNWACLDSTKGVRYVLTQRSSQGIKAGKTYRIRFGCGFENAEIAAIFFVSVGGVLVNDGESLPYSGVPKDYEFIIETINGNNVEFIIEGAGTGVSAYVYDGVYLEEVLYGEDGRIDHIAEMDGHRYEFGTFLTNRWDSDLAHDVGYVYDWEKEFRDGLMEPVFEYWYDRQVYIQRLWEQDYLAELEAESADDYAHTQPWEAGRLSRIYRDEGPIGWADGNDQLWSSMQYSVYSSEVPSLFALNGKDRKRIEADQVHNWGIDAPERGLSAAENSSASYTYDWEADFPMTLVVANATTIDACDSKTNWTISPTTGNMVLWNDNKMEGDYSLKTTWPAGLNQAYVSKTMAAQDWSNVGTIYLWLISYDVEQYPSTPGSTTGRALVVDMTTSNVSLSSNTQRPSGGAAPSPQPKSTLTFEFGEASYSENVFKILKPPNRERFRRIAIDISKVPAGSKNAVAYMRIRRKFAKATTRPMSLYVDHIHSIDQTEVSLVAQLFTKDYFKEASYVFDWERDQLNGDPQTTDRREAMYMYNFETIMDEDLSWDAVFTYCRKRDNALECESNPSPVTTISAGQGFGVAWPPSVDDQVTHVRLYRSLPDGDNYYYDAEFDANLGQATLNPDDTALGPEVEYTHNRPPLGQVTAGPTLNGTCFILKDNFLHYCLPKRPEYWPSTYNLEISPTGIDCKAIVFYNGQPYVLTTQDIFQIQGTDHGGFFPFPMSARTGTLSQATTLAVRGHGIFHTGQDGIYLAAGGKDERITESRFGPIFRGEDRENMPGLHTAYVDNCWMAYYRTKIYFAYPSRSVMYPDNVLVFNVADGRSTHYSYGHEFTAAVVDAKNDRLIVASSDGYVWKLEDNSLKTDNGTAIAWDIQSKEFGDQVRKYFPRYARYDIGMANGAVATAHVIVNGATKSKHPIRGDRDTGKRHINTCTGDRVAIRIVGTGRARVYAAEVE